MDHKSTRQTHQKEKRLESSSLIAQNQEKAVHAYRTYPQVSTRIQDKPGSNKCPMFNHSSILQSEEKDKNYYDYGFSTTLR